MVSGWAGLMDSYLDVMTVDKLADESVEMLVDEKAKALAE
jgi:hypothetical protein